MQHFSIFSCVLIPIFCVSCITRAPSNYELDRRAGLPPRDLTKFSHKEVVKEMHGIQGQDKQSIDPKRIEPRVEKVWIYNQELNDGTYLQGTFMFMQIDNGYWLSPENQK